MKNKTCQKNCFCPSGQSISEPRTLTLKVSTLQILKWRSLLKFLIRILKKMEQRHLDKLGFFSFEKPHFGEGKKNLSHDDMYFSSSDIINELLHAESRCRTDIQTAEMISIAKVEDYRFVTEEMAFLSCLLISPYPPKMLPLWFISAWNNLTVFIYFIQIQKVSLLGRNLSLIFKYQLSILIA